MSRVRGGPLFPSHCIKRTLELNRGFINTVCPLWERAGAKAIWHHTTVGSQTDEEMLSEKCQRITQCDNLFVYACSIIFWWARKALVIKEIFRKPSQNWLAKEDTEHSHPRCIWFSIIFCRSLSGKMPFQEKNNVDRSNKKVQTDKYLEKKQI